MADPQSKPDDAFDNTALGRDLRSLQKTVAEREARDRTEGRAAPFPVARAAPVPAKVIQLPLWPEPVRGTPNSFLRSALFAAIQGKGRKQMKRELLASMQGIIVRFTGEQLDQSDLDVWEQAVHLARKHPLGNVCHFTGYAFLKALGRSTGAADYEWLHSAIIRLIACAVELRRD